MSGHTPTPWVVERHNGSPRPEDWRAIADLISTESGTMQALWIAYDGTDREARPTTKNAEADAAFIVRACNSHEALVEACDGALGLCIAFAATWAEQRGHALGDFHPIHAETIRQLRAALALSESK